MNININKKVTNFNSIRRSFFSNNIFSKNTLVKLKTFFILYYNKIIIQNNFFNQKFKKPINYS